MLNTVHRAHSPAPAGELTHGRFVTQVAGHFEKFRNAHEPRRRQNELAEAGRLFEQFCASRIGVAGRQNDLLCMGLQAREIRYLAIELRKQPQYSHAAATEFFAELSPSLLLELDKASNLSVGAGLSITAHTATQGRLAQASQMAASSGANAASEHRNLQAEIARFRQKRNALRQECDAIEAERTVLRSDALVHPDRLLRMRGLEPIPDGFVRIEAEEKTFPGWPGSEAAGAGLVQHTVRLNRPFLMQQHLVTQSQFEALMGFNPSHFWCAEDARNCPVEQVNLIDSMKYCNALSEKEGLTPYYTILEEPDKQHPVVWPAEDADARYGYRIAHEIEWLYAAHSGSTKKVDVPLRERGHFGGDMQPETTKPVGQKKPNAAKIYDQVGDVYEWTVDYYVPPNGTERLDFCMLRDDDNCVIVGGSFHTEENEVGINCRSALDCTESDFDIGFRVVRTVRYL